MTELTPEPFYGEFETRRMPDAVRAAALANAVDLAPAIVQQGNKIDPDEILDWARTFETYLTGEEAHDS